MKVHLLAKQFPLTPALRGYAERRLRTGLSFARDRIGDVVVRLGDINGPRGGNDKQCHILIAVPGQPALVVRDVQADLYSAIDRAVKRAAHTLRQAVMQRRYLERWGHRNPARPRHAAADALAVADAFDGGAVPAG
ncbi:HPF/RaiA family ribosome-associated protein [Massilia sp. IC2-278]|uniref:HPF/RaiA family ribosome-associated protein n=1 Tax=Massilia sp. IC2-278 TaxID=2887200 RepID=UPI001E374505|nr:HPF/RaiA family ribosome-associated protein [Massilia sp. IC2-278]MCC2962655.1 HPF/RaiA family ribosome-associated protein [Massilia sp. IC2-278]